MIYVVESALRKGHTDSQWSEFYSNMKPMPLLLSVDGLDTAQRFKGLGDPPSYLAVYSVRSAGVMSSAAYRGIGGGNFLTERWKPMLSMWTRNLYAGADQAPEVAADHVLLLVDRDERQWSLDVPVTWLESAGLDRTSRWRGFAQAPADRVPELLAADPQVRAYRPMTPRMTKPAA